MVLREWRSLTLDDMRKYVAYVEGNMATFRKIKLRLDNSEKNKYKEESHARAYSFDSQYLNIYEMENLIRALSNKLT